MELTPFTIYLIMQADRIINISTIIFVILIVVTALSGIAWGAIATDACNERERRTARFFGKAFAGMCISAILVMATTALVPSTKTLVMMYGVPAAIHSADAVHLDETAKKSIAAVNKLLDNYLEQK